MKKQKTLVCLLLSLVLVLSACQSETEPEESTAYRNYFTEAEKEDGTANFELMENVKVDARITLAEKYSSGLKKYYMKHYFEAGKDNDNREKFKKNLRLYGKTIPEIQKLIEKEMGGKFIGKSKFENEEYYDGETGDIDLSQSFQKGDDTYEFWADWYFDGPWQSKPRRFNCPSLRVKIPQDVTDEAENIMRFCLDYREMQTPFIEDRNAEAEKLQIFLENLIGRKIADDWDFIPVTAEATEKVDSVLKRQSYSDSSDKQGDYGLFWFYADVAGLPFIDLQLQYNMKEGETANKVSRAGSPSDTSTILLALSEPKQVIKVSGDGIIELSTSRFRMEGDVYKDTAEVIDPDKILEQIEKYYNRLLLTSPVTVTDIRLAYAGYFTDGSEGEIQPSVAPFWIVNVYVGGEMGTAQFVYDAFTGEAIKEGV